MISAPTSSIARLFNTVGADIIRPSFPGFRTFSFHIVGGGAMLYAARKRIPTSPALLGMTEGRETRPLLKNAERIRALRFYIILNNRGACTVPARMPRRTSDYPALLFL